MAAWLLSGLAPMQAEKRAEEFGAQLHEMEEALLREVEEEREVPRNPKPPHLNPS